MAETKQETDECRQDEGGEGGFVFEVGGVGREIQACEPVGVIMCRAESLAFKNFKVSRNLRL